MSCNFGFFRRGGVRLCWLWLVVSLPVSPVGAEIRLVAKSGAEAVVSGVKRADASGLLVQMGEGEALQKLPWHFIDLDELGRQHPTIHTAYRRAKQGGEMTDLDLGTCQGMVLSDAYPFDPATGFERLDGVMWVDNAFGDGDSFHALHEGDRYIFRLYHVDAPESDLNYPDRVEDQCEYFGLERSEILDLAGEATASTQRLLGRPFTVFTKWEDARGNSSLPRNYAFVLLEDGKMLSEHLVSDGLVRVYGMVSDAPDGTGKGEWIDRLKALEDGAKAGEKGGWGRPDRDAEASEG